MQDISDQLNDSVAQTLLFCPGDSIRRPQAAGSTAAAAKYAAAGEDAQRGDDASLSDDAILSAQGGTVEPGEAAPSAEEASAEFSARKSKGRKREGHGHRGRKARGAHGGRGGHYRARGPTPRFEPVARSFGQMTVRVTNQTSLAAAQALSQLKTVDGDAGSVAVLNFASARNPGGGFIKGSIAQEEALAICSGLYKCLTAPVAKPYYTCHREIKDPLYSDHIIYSPEVPVFRHDTTYKLLDEPYQVSFITSPAVNAGNARGRSVPERVIEDTMARRIHRALNLAAEFGHKRLVLGAWGCGVFKNDPHSVAAQFRTALTKEFRDSFTHVTFAILDNDVGLRVGPFAQMFSSFGQELK